MSLIDINELPQPIYPDQKKNDPAPATSPASATNAAAEPVSEAPAPDPATTETETKSTTSSIDFAALARRKEARIAAIALVVLAAIGGFISGGDDDGGRSFANDSDRSTSTQVSSSTDDSLAGTLEQVLFAYSRPSGSAFDCMADVLGGNGYDSNDLVNGQIDERTMGNAVSGCVSSSTLTTEAQGLVTAMYGQSYAAECLTGVFATFDSVTWNEWVSLTLYMDIEALDSTMVSMAPSCFF